MKVVVSTDLWRLQNHDNNLKIHFLGPPTRLYNGSEVFSDEKEC